MPNGPKHTRSYWAVIDGEETFVEEDCRCTFGDDHNDSEQLSTDEAEMIWLSSGKDPDYDFR